MRQASLGASAVLRGERPCYARKVPNVPKQLAPLAYGAAGGLSVGFSGEPCSYNVLAFVGVALLAHAVQCARALSRPHLRSLFAGFAFGTSANAVALGSVVDLLEQFGHFPAYFSWPTAALCWFAQGAPYAVACAATSIACARSVPQLVAFPLALTAALGSVPQLFPWHVGTTQIDFLWFAQIADLGGEAALDLSLGVASVGLAGVWQGAAKSRRSSALALVLALLLPCIYGAVRLTEVRKLREQAGGLRIGVAQPNVDIHEKHDPALRAQILNNLRELTHSLEARGADLTVWPETAYPYMFSRLRRQAPTDQRAILSERVHGPIVMGLVSYANDAKGLERRYNTAWLVKKGGALGSRVDKTRLLAFGEYVPFWDLLPPLQKRFPSPGFAAGRPDVIDVNGPKLGMLICYEDLFFAMARGVVRRGAEVLVNMTNDAWFGRGHVPGLHDMMAHLRAIETRRDLVRAVNTGVSSFTLATGENVKRTPIFERTSFIADTRRLELQTLYVRLGDLLTPLCLLVLVGLSLRKRRTGSSEQL